MLTQIERRLFQAEEGRREAAEVGEGDSESHCRCGAPTKRAGRPCAECRSAHDEDMRDARRDEMRDR